MPDVRGGIGAEWNRHGAVSMSDKTIGSTSYTSVGVTTGSADGLISDTGCRAGGQAVAGVDPDPLADPEGPTGIEGQPAAGIPVGVPLGS